VGRPKKFDPDAAVEKAMEVFWVKGYAATTPQDLVEGMGIGAGSLYNAFNSKHDLYQRVLERYYEQESVKLVAELNRPGPPRARLRGALEAIIEFDLQDPHRRGCLATNAAMELAGRDEMVTRMVRRMFDRLERALQATIEEGQRSGEIDPRRDPAALASFLLNTINGMRVLTKTTRELSRLHRIVEETLKTF
jgi:TetR/AcrR family transcriptional regulator, transcriptional repressor for nem operon